MRTKSSIKRLEESRKLYQFRQRLQLSQRDLANEFQVAHGAISLWESGERSMPGPVLKLIEIYESELRSTLSENAGVRTLGKIQTSWLSRNLKLAALATNIAGLLGTDSIHSLLSDVPSGLKGRKNAHEAIARKLAESLGDLKGLAMKLGQMLSYVEFGFPEQAQRILAGLQDSTTPMESSVVEAIIEREFGQTVSDVFRDWSSRPIAAASIGQVHWARLKDGREVAVKVQYPEIQSAIETDLRNAKACRFLTEIFFPKQDIKGVLTELRDRFLEECDYRKEAQNQELVRSLFKSDPDVIVPEVIWPFSTGKILTTEYIAGKRFHEFLSCSGQSDRNRAGEILFRTAMKSVFLHGILQADPHPGNYLFVDNKVVFLDFGCVKRFETDFVKWWKQYICTVMTGDRGASDQLVCELGYAPEPKDFDFDYHHEAILFLYKPWLEDRTFRFDHEYVRETWTRLVKNSPNKFSGNLPRDWLFVNRLQWGLFSVLAMLNSESNWHLVLAPLVTSEP